MVMSHQQASEVMPHNSQQRTNTDEFGNKVNQLMGELRVESDTLQRESTEIEMLLRQTTMEVEKLAQREHGATNRVRDMELNLDNYSRTDMKTIYNSAHEIQMRLFMMRAQVEQLEVKRNSMKTLQQRLQRVTAVLMSAPEGYNPGSNYQTSRQMLSTPLQTLPEADDSFADSKQMLTQIIQTQESERLRVSRQIHDGPAQTMTNLVLRAEICERLLDFDLVRAKAELSGLKSVVTATLQETRRFIFDLRPMILDDLGLEPTLRRYVQQFVDKHKMEVGVVINGMNGRLPGEIEVAIFRIVQEALENVAQHAHAKHAQVTLDINGETVVVTVEDDGAGFAIDETKLNDPKFKGLSTMRQRVDMFGGRLQFDSTPGRGTRLVTTLPTEWTA
ncbi:MAG TPA: ATP-binding protein [Chloroflexia bacterium]|nr:ATP-binding protein [Chloroflexia bacterium]